MMSEYQKMIHLLDNTSNPPSKFRTKNWIEVNDKLKETYNTNSDIRFKTTILKFSLFDNSDAHILVKERITITGVGDTIANRQTDE